jgi:hypothetical protein
VKLTKGVFLLTPRLTTVVTGIVKAGLVPLTVVGSIRALHAVGEYKVHILLLDMSIEVFITVNV